jgi:hypothetical protein
MGLFGNDPIGPPLFKGGPFRGKPFVPAPGGGSGGGAGFGDFFTARRASNQTTNVNIGNHFELNLGFGPAATVSTGSGQAQGLVTVAISGTYYVGFGTRFEVNEGDAVLNLYDDTAGSPLLDDAGKSLRIIGHDNVGTDSAEMSWASSVFTLTAGDVLKLEITNDTNLVQIENLFASFLMVKL